MTQPDHYANIGALGVPWAEDLPGVAAPRRGAVYGRKFAVATDHPLASLAAMNVMQRGGNAADAAIAAAAVNVVTKPHRTQLGGDCFFLVWRKGPNTVDCLNAGGLAPLEATLGALPQRRARSPARSPAACPGSSTACWSCTRCYATLPLEKLLEPAIALRRGGLPGLDAPRRRHDDARRTTPDACSAELRRVFLKDGARPTRAGETLRQPELADTLQRIDRRQEDEREASTRARRRADRAGDARAGGIIDENDLEKTHGHWHEAAHDHLRRLRRLRAGAAVAGHHPPRSAEHRSRTSRSPTGACGSADAVHVMVEATKLAFADSRRYVADPARRDGAGRARCSRRSTRAERAAEIDIKRAARAGGRR